MRLCRILLVVVSLFGAAQAHAGDWFGKVYVRYESERNFKRISEYFTGEENLGCRLVVRQPENDRAGLYWVILLEQAATHLPDGAQLRVTFYRPGALEPESRAYALANDRSVNTIYAGVTGMDWPEMSQLPTAWQLEILNAQGEILDVKESFLWRYPRQ